jgi:hypothetical protein
MRGEWCFYKEYFTPDGVLKNYNGKLIKCQ